MLKKKKNEEIKAESAGFRYALVIDDLDCFNLGFVSFLRFAAFPLADYGFTSVNYRSRCNVSRTKPSQPLHKDSVYQTDRPRKIYQIIDATRMQEMIGLYEKKRSRS